MAFFEIQIHFNIFLFSMTGSKIHFCNNFLDVTSGYNISACFCRSYNVTAPPCNADQVIQAMAIRLMLQSKIRDTVCFYFFAKYLKYNWIIAFGKIISFSQTISNYSNKNFDIQPRLLRRHMLDTDGKLWCESEPFYATLLFNRTSKFRFCFFIF